MSRYEVTLSQFKRYVFVSFTTNYNVDDLF